MRLPVLAALVAASAVLAGAKAQTTAAAEDRLVFAWCIAGGPFAPGESRALKLQMQNPTDFPVAFELKTSWSPSEFTSREFGGWKVDVRPSADVSLAPRTRGVLELLVTAPPATDTTTARKATLYFGPPGYPPADGELPQGSFFVGSAALARQPGAEACDRKEFLHGPSTFSPAHGPLPAPDSLAAREPVRTHEVRAPESPASRAVPAPSGSVIAATAVAGLGAFVTSLWLALRNESARWRAFLPFLGLFTRFAKPDVLSQATREKIYALVQQEPGIHLTALREKSGVNTSTLIHHLRMLERHQLIASRKEGRLRRFFAVGAALASAPPAPLASFHAEVARVVEARGEVVFADLARELGVSKQRLSYAVKILEERGAARLVQRDGDGRWVLTK